MIIGLLLLTSLAFLSAGCGGGGETTSEPLTKSEFLKQANTACAKRLKEKDVAVRRGLLELQTSQGQSPSDEEIETLFVEAVLPPYKALVRELGELPPPAEDAGTVEQLVKEYEAGLADAEGKPKQAIESGPFEDANEAASAYGLESCVL